MPISPRKSDKYQWTNHALFKMQYYGLSPQRITRVIKSPQRIEEGIVENTVAVMQPTSLNTKNGQKSWSSEIWAMYQIGNSKFEARNSKQIQNPKFKTCLPIGKIQNSANQKIRIISAWRYPGVSPERNPIPREILEEIKSVL